MLTNKQQERRSYVVKRNEIQKKDRKTSSAGGGTQTVLWYFQSGEKSICVGWECNATGTDGEIRRIMENYGKGWRILKAPALSF